MVGGLNQQGAYKIDARFNKVGLIKKIRAIAARKEQIILSNMDAQELIKSNYLERFNDAFINFDPPYVNKGYQLYKNAFTEEDHGSLSQEIATLTNQQWIVTYDICPLVTDLYKNYRCSYLDVTYSVNRNKKAKEYIFFSNTLCLPDYIEVL